MTSRSETAVAVAQFAPVADTAANLAVIRSLAETAAARGAQLVVFPEYSTFFLPDLGQDLVDAAEELSGPSVTALAQIAINTGVTLVAGVIERTSDPSRLSNTLVAINASGDVVARYRKLHLYDAFGASESAWVVPGDIETPETFVVGDFVVGLQTCYDLRFPEVTRRLVDAGATMVVVPSEWVRGPQKEHHWRTLVTARALENTIFVAAADHAPPVGVGNSMIVDPMGVDIATVGDNTDVAVGVVAISRLEAVRATNPALALRRFAVVPVEEP